jgi:hypothetical protein
VSDGEWRSVGRYAGLGALPPADLAWEFLRRNPDYQNDYRSWNEVGSIETMRAGPAPWARWGLSFCC